MTVLLLPDETIELNGFCSLDDVEKLYQYLLAKPEASINWHACTGAHTAVIQLLLASSRIIEGSPQDNFLQTFVAPLMQKDASKGGYNSFGSRIDAINNF